MSNTISLICEVILIFLIGWHFIYAYISKDRALMWSPITTIALTYFYYVSVPFWGGTIEKYQVDEDLYNGYLFHIATLLSYIFILIGFYKSGSGKTNFKKWNSYFTEENSGKMGILLFLIAMVCYVPFRGLHLSISGESSPHQMVSGGFVYYFIFMTNMFVVASSLMLIRLKKGWKNWLYIAILWFILIQEIFAGARWLIVVTGLTFLATYYLYPKPKKINIPILAVLAVVAFLGFAIMDKSRQRGAGINMDAATALKYDDIKGGAEENYGVYWFSLMSVNKLNETGERVYFQPLLTAVLMPVPRSIFPWKPDDAYLDKIETVIFGNADGGAAFLNYVESFMAVGWFGVVFMAWILGWIARKFWDNYRNNPESIGAVIAMGAFGSVCYCIISRGYLASTVTNIILVVYLPFWVVGVIRKYFVSLR